MPDSETKPQAVPDPAPIDTTGRKLTLDEAEKIAQRVLQAGLTSRYVECPQCGVLVLRTDPVCYRDRIVFDAENVKWYPLEEPAPGEPETPAEPVEEDEDEPGEVIPGLL